MIEERDGSLFENKPKSQVYNVRNCASQEGKHFSPRGQALLNIHGGEPESLADGLYELLHTKELAERIEAQPELQAAFEMVSDDLSPDVLATYIASQARRTLAAASPADRVALANSILGDLHGAALIQAGPQQMTSLFPPED